MTTSGRTNVRQGMDKGGATGYNGPMRISVFSDIDLYPVTGRSHYAGRYSDQEAIAALAAGGAKIVQLREKGIDDRTLYELARLFREETSRHGMLFIVDDRIDIAQAVKADGVHLGRGDLPLPAARKIVGPSMILGASSHDPGQAVEAERLGADYVNVGPLFATPTKPSALPIGLTPLAEAVKAVSIPVTCMGGINGTNLDAVLATGARHPGVVSAVFGADDIAGATRSLASRIQTARGA